MSDTKPMSDTKEKILDAAERIFAEHGYAAASLRSIIAKAGVNLAAVHYHFGSKEELLRAVLRRRVGPVNEERLRLLDECERAAGSGRLSLEKVLEAFLAPALRLARQPGGTTVVRLMGRLYVDTLLSDLVRQEFSDVLERFRAALRRALPGLPEPELMWRAYLALGAMAQAMRGADTIPAIAERLKEASEDEILAGLVAFLSAGFRCPLRHVAAQES